MRAGSTWDKGATLLIGHALSAICVDHALVCVRPPQGDSAPPDQAETEEGWDCATPSTTLASEKMQPEGAEQERLQQE